MNYLVPSEYEAYNLEAATAAAWVTAASAMIDAHCRRASLAVTQYSERLRLEEDRNTVRVSYVPVVAVVSARGRYAMPRRGEWSCADLASDVATTFGLPGTWLDLDPTLVDACAATGELTLPGNALGLGFSEVELTYTAGLAQIPDGVKVACAQIVKNAQGTAGLNVRSGQIDRIHFEYFSDSLLDQTVRMLLAPYVAQKVG